MRSKHRTTRSGLLREVWRVLSGGGRLLAVVPNRRGLWARMDTTPFGHGRPYSRSQITHLLRETWFTPTGWGEALYVPPIARGWFLRSAVAWERTGATISAPFAGVHIVEATQAGLSRHPGPARAAPLRAVAAAGARARARRRRAVSARPAPQTGHGSLVTAAASAPTSSPRLSRRRARARQ